MDQKTNGLSLECRELLYYFDRKSTLRDRIFKRAPKQLEPLVILNNVNCSFRASKMTAILGASGAGKTSLLKILSCDTTYEGSVNGHIYVNGSPLAGGLNGLEGKCGRVSQDDIIMSTMTVYEAVAMSAKLRLPREMSLVEKDIRVRTTIKMLGLEKCQNSCVGTISGGERRRTSIAMELVTNPPIIFFDEPTSGLDTLTAFKVMSQIKFLSTECGQTMIASIHQPSSEIFHLFDDLLILARGCVIYNGPKEELVEYIAQNTGKICPKYTNPADFVFMEVFSDEACVNQLIHAWTKRKESLLADNFFSPHYQPIPHAIDIPSPIKPSFFQQFSLLAIRAAKNALRNKMLLRAKLSQSIAIGLLIGTIYWKIPTRTLASQKQNLIGALYFMVLNQFMSSAMGVVSIFSQEKVVFLREYKQGYYSLLAYYASKCLIETPYQIAGSFIYISISYFMIGLRKSATHFLITMAIVVLSALTGSAVGIAAASSFKDISTALAILPLLLLPLMLFSGMLINTGELPIFLRWIPYISPTKYAYSALLENELQDRTLGPDTTGKQLLGNDILREMAILPGPNILTNVLILLGFYVFLVILGSIALWLVSRSRRRTLNNK